MTDETWGQRRTAFGSAAADYAVGRPHYPPEALTWGLPDHASAVIDLGAGTGILTRDLLDLGLSVTAIEPLTEMRALIPDEATALDGNAEAIPAESSSADAIFVGQAWHWFDAERALAEAHRVLRPGGRLVLLWNLLDASDALSRNVADIVKAEDRSDSLFSDEATTPPYDAPTMFGDHEQLVIPHVQGYDVDRITAFAASRSATILLDDEGRDALIAELLAAVPAEPFPINWFCEAWRATAI